MRWPPNSRRRCAAARWAKPGDATVSDVLRWGQVSGRRQMAAATGRLQAFLSDSTLKLI